MSQGPSLLPDERLLWAGLRGQPVALPGGAMGCRMAYAYLLLFFFGGISVIPLLAFPETRLYAILAVLAIVAAAVAFRVLRKRPSIFVTDRRVLDRSLFGTTSVDLAAVRTYRRRVDRYRDRYGNVTDVATNHLLLGLRDGRVLSVGPVLEYNELTTFLDGVLSGDVDPTKMRGLDGKPSAAEQREDLYVALSCRGNDETYGPIFIGPRGLVRFTDRLPLGLEALLLTALARPEPPEALESRVVSLARRPDAGHALIVDLSAAELAMEGTSVRLRTPERTEHIQLGAQDAMRARKYLQARS